MVHARRASQGDGLRILLANGRARPECSREGRGSGDVAREEAGDVDEVQFVTEGVEHATRGVSHAKLLLSARREPSRSQGGHRCRALHRGTANLCIHVPTHDDEVVPAGRCDAFHPLLERCIAGCQRLRASRPHRHAIRAIWRKLLAGDARYVHNNNMEQGAPARHQARKAGVDELQVAVDCGRRHQGWCQRGAHCQGHALAAAPGVMSRAVPMVVA